MLANLLIFGGTFDPVHYGHLKAVMNVQKHFQFAQVRFLPCKLPLLKNKASAAAEHRIAMLQQALLEYADHRFVVDDREIRRASPSYMTVTLQSYREEFGDKLPLILLMGIDSFYQLPQWYEWQKLIQQAHILVMHRPLAASVTAPPAIIELLAQHQVQQPTSLMTMPAGTVYLYNAGHYQLSSTWLRKKLLQPDCTTELCHYLPQSVLLYIKKHHLYLSSAP